MLKIKTKHKETRPNKWLAGLHVADTEAGPALRNNSGYVVTVHARGPYAEFRSETEVFALWITQAQFEFAAAILAAE